MSSPQDTLELLRNRFPKCFAQPLQPRQPLKIGIHNDVYVALTGAVSRRALHKAFTAYTKDPAYRERLTPGTVRIDLSGEPAGVVTPEQIPRPPKPKSKSKPTPEPTREPTVSSPKRLSLADLKAAARRRTEGGTP